MDHNRNKNPVLNIRNHEYYYFSSQIQSYSEKSHFSSQIQSFTEKIMFNMLSNMIFIILNLIFIILNVIYIVICIKMFNFLSRFDDTTP